MIDIRRPALIVVLAFAVTIAVAGCSANDSSSLAGTDAAKLPTASPSQVQQAITNNEKRKWRAGVTPNMHP